MVRLTTGFFFGRPQLRRAAIPKVARDAGWNAASWMALATLSFASSAIIFRAVGAENYGIWATVIAIRTMLMFLDGGLALGVSRDAARINVEQRDSRRRIASALRIYLVLGVMVAFAGIVASDLPGALLGLTDADRAVAKIVVVIVALDTGLALSASPLAALLRGRGKFRVLAIGSLLQALVGILLLVLLTPSLGLIGSACALIIARLLATIWYGGWLLSRDRRLLGGSGSRFKEVATFAAPLWVIGAAAQIGLGTDVPIVAAAYGPNEASAYALGSLLPAMSASLLFVLVDSTYPRLAVQTGDLAFQLGRLFLVSTFLGGLGLGVLVLNAEAVLIAWVGTEPPLTTTVLTLYAITRMANIPAHVLTIAAIAQSKHRVVAPFVLGEAVVSFVLSVVLAAVWSPLGPAVATLATISVSNLVILPMLLIRKLSVSVEHIVSPSVIGGTAGLIIALGISAAASSMDSALGRALTAVGLASAFGVGSAVLLTRERGTRLAHAVLHNGIPVVLREMIEILRARRRLRALRDAPVVWIQGRAPLVSVRIATYNRGQLIVDRAIESALTQTYDNLEVVVVGDACDAATERAVRSVRDPRVRFENLPERGRYPADARYGWMVAGSAPMNRALDLALGEWTAPLDDDDEFTTDHIELLLDVCRARNLEFAYGAAEMQFGPDDWRVVGSWPPRRGQVVHASVLYSMRLAFLKYNGQSWRLGEPADWNLWRRMLSSGVRMGYVDRVVCRHYAEARAVS